MIRLFNIEWYKFKKSKASIILFALFCLFLISIPISVKFFFDYLTTQGETAFGMDVPLNKLPLFDFVDIWQNLTYIYTYGSILLGFIVIISVCREYSYGTLKQHIIDGLSRKEFLWSKVIFILAGAAMISIVIFLIGLCMGMAWSPVRDFYFIVKNLEFIPAYFLHLVAFLMLCLTISLLFKRSGLTMAFLIFYVWMIEPILTGILRFRYDLLSVAELLPINAISRVIRMPYGKYVLQESSSSVAFVDLMVLGIYLAGIYFIALRLMTARDLS